MGFIIPRLRVRSSQGAFLLPAATKFVVRFFFVDFLENSVPDFFTTDPVCARHLFFFLGWSGMAEIDAPIRLFLPRRISLNGTTTQI